MRSVNGSPLGAEYTTRLVCFAFRIARESTFSKGYSFREQPQVTLR